MTHGDKKERKETKKERNQRIMIKLEQKLREKLKEEKKEEREYTISFFKSILKFYYVKVVFQVEGGKKGDKHQFYEYDPLLKKFSEVDDPTAELNQF